MTQRNLKLDGVVLRGDEDAVNLGEELLGVHGGVVEQVAVDFSGLLGGWLGGHGHGVRLQRFHDVSDQ